MSEQQFQGTLASGGTFITTGQGIRILDPAGNQLASFSREAISGVSRDGQIVTVERHNDSIVTLTAASITDAVGLEQFVRDTIIALPTQPEPPGEDPAPPLAIDAFDDEAGTGKTPDTDPSRPQIISRLDPSYEAESRHPEHDLPEPVPTAPASGQPEPAAPAHEAPRQPPDEPDRPAAPPGQYPAPPPLPETGAADESSGRRLWLWGCLGCGGLFILAVICIAVVLATGAIDFDELTGEDATPTPHVIVATLEEDENGDADSTLPEAAVEETTPIEATEGDEEPAVDPPEGVLTEGEAATLGDFQVTYLGSRIDTSGIFPPDPGNEYLILGFRFENTGTEPAFVSTLSQFALRNQAGEGYSVALFADIESTLDTEVPAGETLEGELAFEVPEGSGSYIVEFDDLVSNSPLQWAVN